MKALLKYSLFADSQNAFFVFQIETKFFGKEKQTFRVGDESKCGRKNIYFIQIDFLWHILLDIERIEKKTQRGMKRRPLERVHIPLAMLKHWNFTRQQKSTANKQLHNWKWLFFVAGKVEKSQRIFRIFTFAVSYEKNFLNSLLLRCKQNLLYPAGVGSTKRPYDSNWTLIEKQRDFRLLN